MGAYYQGRCLTDSDATRQYFSSIPTVVDSSTNPKGVADGKMVNIPLPALVSMG